MKIEGIGPQPDAPTIRVEPYGADASREGNTLEGP